MKYAVFRKKMSPVGEYASSLVFLTLPLSIFNQTTLGIVSEKGGIGISFITCHFCLNVNTCYTLYVEIVSILRIQ